MNHLPTNHHIELKILVDGQYVLGLLNPFYIRITDHIDDNQTKIMAGAQPYMVLINYKMLQRRLDVYKQTQEYRDLKDILL